MAIVSNVPFELRFDSQYCNHFETEDTAVFSDDFPAIQIYENNDTNILFNSDDPNARLYLDALDIIPDEFGVSTDEDGYVYRKASKYYWPLYQNTDEFDALRVDSFKIMIICNGAKYYSRLDVLPKQLDYSEWRMMRDDLEKEITGLAQDIVRRNIGLGSQKEGSIPPEKLYNFFVIKKHAAKVLGALIELKDTPKYHIVNEYVDEKEELVRRMDSVTVRKYLRHGGVDTTYAIPVKRISYDIPENRLLKSIIFTYDSELLQFVSLLEKIKEERKKNKHKEHKQYRVIYDQSIDDFLDTAHKLQGISSIIKSQSWYNDVSVVFDGIVPHSFVLDSRYGILFKMYQELIHKEFNVKLDPYYSYSWKKSSSLYEMWCYLKLCRALSEEYSCETDVWNLQYGDDQLFPYLSNGVSMSFSNDEVKLNVIFDQFVPRSEAESNKEASPFYCVGNHRRPDITVDMYDKANNWYLGTIILECKYRKLNSFFRGEKSSRPQLQAYYTDNRSRYLFGLENIFDDDDSFDYHPIEAVVVLTPDLQGKGKKAAEIKMEVVPLKPGDDEMVEQLKQIIEKKLKKRRKQCEKFASLRAIH